MDNQHNNLVSNKGNGGVDGENVPRGASVPVMPVNMPIFSKDRPLTEVERADLELRGQVGKVGIRASNVRGGIFGGHGQRAKDLTAEINRATDIELKAGTNSVTAQDRPQEKFMPRQNWLSNNSVRREQVNNNFNNNRIQQAERELKQDQLEMQGELAGVESKVETQEYLKTDQELLRAEEGVGWGGKILKKANGALTSQAKKGIEEALSKSSSPLEIEKLRYKLMNAAIGREFGRAA